MTEQWETGKLLQAARERAGLSKRQAAYRAGISETWWRQIESGVIMRDGTPVPITPPIETIAKAAIVVDLDPRVLPGLIKDEDDEDNVIREILVARIRTLRGTDLRVAEAYITGMASSRG